MAFIAAIDNRRAVLSSETEIFLRFPIIRVFRESKPFFMPFLTPYLFIAKCLARSDPEPQWTATTAQPANAQAAGLELAPGVDVAGQDGFGIFRVDHLDREEPVKPVVPQQLDLPLQMV